MFYGILPSKKRIIRLLLRRHIIKSTLELERPRTLQDCVVIQPKRYRTTKTWILVFILPVVCYTCSLLIRDAQDVMSPGLPDGIFADIKGNGLENTQVLYKGDQIRIPPRPSDERQRAKATMWQSYRSIKDKMLQLLNTRKKKHGIVRNNVYISYPMELTTQTTTTSTTTRSPSFEPCKNNQNFNKNANASLRLSDIHEDLEKLYPMVQKGGFYKPPNCWSRHKVALILPYRDRLENLKVFLYNIHPFLIAQKLEYQIFVIEQYAAHKFNRGRLCNAGFKESKKWGQWHCVIFHDVDLLPLSSRIFYNCPIFPRYMSSTVLFINGTDKNIDVNNRFGGVSAVTTQHYEKINGHSNIFWHYGPEEIDIFIRFLYAGIPLVRNKKNISKFVELPHREDKIQSIMSSRILLQNAAERSKYEGLSTLEYAVRKLTLHHLYTHIVVDIDPYALDRTIQPPPAPPISLN